jgi:predicted AAA+ superfamily ATPase
MWIPRDVEPRLARSVRTRPVVVLVGARQTGKTSTLRRLFPDFSFVSLDLPTEAEQAEQEPSAFLRRHPAPAIFDEAQYAPGLFRHLKVAVDAHRSRRGQYLLTGSQKFTLMARVSESLAGRADIIELETLSLAEIHRATPRTTVEDATVRGGFPELHADAEIDPVAFYNSYLATYLERDVRSLANVGSLRDFERFLRACALRSANLLNKADLARDVGVSPSTANAWLSVLEASGQIVLLEPWFSNRTKSIVKSPKLYLADTGLLCALLNVRSVESLRTSPWAGAIWETFVFAQLRHRERRAGRAGSLFFWRDRTREVDFVVDVAGRLEILEAKWTEVADETQAVNLRFVRDVIGRSRIASASVVSRTSNSYPISEGIRVIPVTEC